MDNTIIQAIITGFALVASNSLTFFAVRKKSNADAFKSLVDANEKFRNEIRGDLISAKKEAQEYKMLVNELKSKINEYESQILELKEEILNYKHDRMNYEMEIAELRNRVNNDRK